MPSLGSPQTNKFNIGTAEVRIGPLTEANKLTQAHSVGLLDSVTVEVSQDSVDLLGGYPKILVDTAVTSQQASVTATLREFSRRNMQLLLGEGVVASANEPVDFASTLAAPATSGATSLSLSTDLTGAAGEPVPGSLLVVYPIGDPSGISICRVDSVDVATDIVALDANTPVLQDYAAGAIVYMAQQVGIGNIVETNYFSVQILQTERASGRPIGFNFWKASIASGLSLATNAEDFGSTELTLKLLQPSASEYDVGGDLAHLASIIPENSTGLYFGGGD